MLCRGIPDSDELLRHSLFPLAFQSKVFLPEKLWRFFDEEDGAIEASLAWQRYVPTLKLVHEFGCRVAAKINAEKRAAGKFRPRNRHIYCGAYVIDARSVRSLVGMEGLNEIASANVVHQIEKGEIAHSALKVVLKQGDFDREATKTAILDRLWQASRGPATHVCDEDRDIEDHPRAKLLAAPGGDYVDTRHRIYRLWCLARFHTCNWIWQQYCKLVACFQRP